MSNNQSFGKGLKLYKEKKYAEAVTYFKEAVEQGDAAAQNYLANCYLCGLGVAKNEEEAVKLYRRAVGQSYASAMLNLGYCYENGLGVKKNEEFASDYYERAANLGNTIAMINLGLMYRDGRGLDKSISKAEEWFKKAKAKGNTTASMYLTGNSYTSSSSTPVKPTPVQPKPAPVKPKTTVVKGNANFRIMEFGKYPQSLVTDSALINKLSASRENSNGIISLNGVEYVKVKTARLSIFDNCGYRKYDNGQTISQGKEYYFKVEPIKWLVLEEGNTLKLLSEKVLNCYTRNTIEYGKSSVRTWLEQEFYNKWLEKNKSIIKQTLDNSFKNGSKNYQDITEDYVYLLSEREVLKYFGEGQKNTSRLAYTTDYARAVGCYSDDTYNIGAGIWLLSTPTGGWDYSVKGISRTGGIYNYGTYLSHYGIRPVITISNSGSSRVELPKTPVNVQSSTNTVELGYFPQTIVSDNNLCSKLSGLKPGNDGYITYLGQKYVKVTKQEQFYLWNQYHNKYSNGEKRNGKNEYFFKVEPIKWIVLNETNDTYELVTEKIINRNYSQYAVTYEGWGSRKWLNGEFLNNVLGDAKKYLVGKLINGEIPTTYKAKTYTDSVYLLSPQDMVNPSYGFSTDPSYCDERRAYVTDYALCVGCYADSDDDNVGIWLLRQPEYINNGSKWVSTKYDYANAISRSGCIYNYYQSNTQYGLRPAITIKKAYFTNGVAETTSAERPRVVEQPRQAEQPKPAERPRVVEQPRQADQPKPATSAQNPAVAPTIKKEPVVVKTVKPVETVNEKEVYYGKYPQSLETNEGIISALNSSTPNANGYYVHNGVEYEKVVAKPYRDKYKFRNGSPVITGKEYYFKVEPIKWNVLSNNNGELLILTSVLLDQVKFHQSIDERTVGGVKINSRNYEYSEIREWLNKYFYKKALSSENGILLSQIDNSTSTCASDYTGEVCNNFADLVFIPSYNEVSNLDYGFSEPGNTCTHRCLKLTDYNIAKGAHMMTNAEYNNNGSWWLRTPNETGEDFVHYVDYDGMINYCLTSNKIRSVAVAIRIKK